MTLRTSSLPRPIGAAFRPPVPRDAAHQGSPPAVAGSLYGVNVYGTALPAPTHAYPAGALVETGMYPGLSKVIERITRLIVEGRADLRVRAKALDITDDLDRSEATGLPERRDADAIASRVYTFMVRNVAYVRDPYGLEQLQAPTVTLEIKAGDCDDHTTLGGALLASLGVPVRVRVVGKGETPSHVFLEYQSRTNGWTPFDTTIAQAPGALAARAFVYDKTYDLPTGQGLGDAADLGAVPSAAELGFQAVLDVFDDPNVRLVDDLTATDDGGFVTVLKRPSVGITAPTFQTLNPTVGAATVQAVTPGQVIDSAADWSAVLADILARLRAGYASATGPTPTPPPTRQQSALESLSPLLLVGGAVAGGVILLRRKHDG